MRFCCPNCGGKLNISDKVALCERGHSFDRARGGYYNLLIGQSGGVHGDNKEMVLARRAFLGGGYYAPLANRIAELVAIHTERGGCLLDAGAGEGYYTDIAERALFERDGVSDVSAFDISKDAVREISKKNPRTSLAVAGSYHMPIADGEFNTVGFEESLDDIEWVKFLNSEMGVRSVIFHGICIGAAGGMLALTNENCPNIVKGIVTEGMFPNFGESMKNNLIQKKKPIFIFYNIHRT